ncbi:DUF1269 domain-containing protein [Sciscionella marina]|uniref:DUF1269 domain-containing protein n=1 Tax=Sciscionella marina TaxID=508770 RepID=UPI0012F6BD11|nr:DUF1269 domain-containing protein [Sciscionella marina]
MPIETKVEGNPGSMRAAANWLRQDFSRAIHGANDKVYGARNSAASGLRGDAADSLQNKLTTGARQADDFTEGISGVSQKVDAAADILQQVQTDMQRIRSEASGAGLQISGTVIQDPGPAPAAPGPAPAGSDATPEATQQHTGAVQAQQDHTAKVNAYNKAKADAEDAHRRWKQQIDQRSQDFQNTKNKTIFTLAGFGVTGGTTAAGVHKSILENDSKELKIRAAQSLKHAEAIGGTDPAGFYKNLDAAAADTAAADSQAARAAKFGKTLSRVGNVGGGVLAAGGVAYDIAHGKPVAQAVTSGAAGFGASVATGAAVGTVIGGPVGTAVGAVAGTVVGAFTSGAVDSMFKHGVGHVGTAIEDGTKAVADTGKAIGSLASDVGSGVKHVWDSIF